MSVSDEGDIPVLLEDQEKINLFSCLSLKLKEKEAAIADLKEQVRCLQDAIEECQLALEPNSLLLKVGDAFISDLEDSEVIQHCEAQYAGKTEQLKAVEAEKSQLESQMGQLKAALYAKFGSQRINLDMA